MLQPGTYNYTFEFKLPNNVPSSIEGDCGWIQYAVNVVVDISIWADQKFEQTFTVIQPINLNPSLKVIYSIFFCDFLLS